MKSTLSYFYVPMAALVAAMAFSLFTWGFAAALTVGILAILEISLSFDNATVNAVVLKNWPEQWRKVFLGAGIIVAVFGMRLLFPILIVTTTTGLGIWAVVQMALHSPAEYARHLTAVHSIVAAFGGAFLCMVGTGFFFDSEKDSHWIGPVEALLSKFGEIEAVQAAITLGAVCVTTLFMPAAEASSFLLAGVLGVLAFVSTKAIGTLLGGGGSKVIQASIGGFLYLEMLDASFSFDGVIGAFAISNYLPIIALGLGVGALTVRELTVMAVDRGTLVEYPYLEHGAFWAILSLSGMMLASAVVDIPEVVTGTVGATLIFAAFVTSLYKNAVTPQGEST